MLSLIKVYCFCDNIIWINAFVAISCVSQKNDIFHISEYLHLFLKSEGLEGGMPVLFVNIFHQFPAYRCYEIFLCLFFKIRFWIEFQWNLSGQKGLEGGMPGLFVNIFHQFPAYRYRGIVQKWVFILRTYFIRGNREKREIVKKLQWKRKFPSSLL